MELDNICAFVAETKRTGKLELGDALYRTKGTIDDTDDARDTIAATVLCVSDCRSCSPTSAPAPLKPISLVP